jgi:hypothetical protein
MDDISPQKELERAIQRLQVMQTKLEQAQKGFAVIGYPKADQARAFYPFRLVDIVDEAADSFWAVVENFNEEN